MADPRDHDGTQGLIDVHAHFIPSAYRAALAKAGLERLDGGMPIPAWSREQALDIMDRHGVEKAILSISSPGISFCDGTAELDLARTLNDAVAGLVADGQGRFGGFATLPFGPAAIREIDRALDELSLDGFILHTHHHGHYPGHESWRPLLEALDARGAVVLLHPTSPECARCQATHGLTSDRPAPLIEFPFDTTRAVVDLIYSGTLWRFPNIRFILPHGGGTLPYLADRIAGFAAIPGMGRDEKLDPAAVLAALGGLYYDTALAASPMHIAALRRVVPSSGILFGSDWPFSPETLLHGAIASIEANADISEEDRAAILSGNARRLLAKP